MPALASVWNHRDMDLTSLRRFWMSEKVTGPHRALPDMYSSIEQYRGFCRLRDLVLPSPLTAGLLELPAEVVTG